MKVFVAYFCSFDFSLHLLLNVKICFFHFSLWLYNPIYEFLSFSERRQAEAARIREKYPDRIPVLEQFYCTYSSKIAPWSF